jgi:hypothetical protein
MEAAEKHFGQALPRGEDTAHGIELARLLAGIRSDSPD